MSKTVLIVKCGCKHNHQDELYGAQNRVANLSTKSHNKITNQADFVCTVCNSKHNHSVEKAH
jgi:hypothetical protein